MMFIIPAPLAQGQQIRHERSAGAALCQILKRHTALAALRGLGVSRRLPGTDLPEGQGDGVADELVSTGALQPWLFMMFIIPDKRIEEGEAQGGAGAVDEGDGITDFAKLPKLPFIGNQGGRDAETDHVGKTVQLFAERALAIGQPCHATVHAVEQHGEEYCNRCRLITPVHELGDGEKGAEQRGDGKHFSLLARQYCTLGIGSQRTQETLLNIQQ